MANLNRYQWHVFAASCIVTAAVLTWDFSIVLPLYLDPELKDRTSTLIHATTVREGWLKSGLTLVSVDDHQAILLYRSHIRGADPVSCHILQLPSGALAPCPQND